MPMIGKRIKNSIVEIFARVIKKMIFFFDIFNKKIFHLMNIKKKAIYGRKKHNRKP